MPYPKTRMIPVLVLGLLPLVGVARAATKEVEQPADKLPVGIFSAADTREALPPGWQMLEFRGVARPTRYSLVRDGEGTVVKAVSNAAAAGLLRKITIDAHDWPVIEWRWKVESVLQAGDPRTKAGDDYPARLYITFAYERGQLGLIERAKFEAARLIYGQHPPGSALTYLWESRLAVGTMVANPYTDRVRMIVVESGPGKAGRWVSERRNVYEDYKRAFNREPPLITGVAIMTDTDNTGEAVVAYYGDIVFRSGAQLKPDPLLQ